MGQAVGRSVVLQAGGESRRMGSDKGLVSFLGQPLIQRVLARVRPLADEVIVTTNNPEAYAFLGIPLAQDIIPGYGALSGLYTALSGAHFDAVAVVACDMPFASAALLEVQFGMLENSRAGAIIPRRAAGLEPFHAVYRRSACLPLVQAAIEQGRRRVDAWFPLAEIHYLEAETIASYDPQNMAFLNVNTPEELAAAEALEHLNS